MNINLKKYKSSVKALFLILGFVILFGCTESFEIENDRIENFLVINATVTDQIGNQRIVLSRTFGFGEDPIPEEGASIVILENEVTEYQFNENSSGEYLSIRAFAVTAGNEYRLSVRTANGRSYTSEKVIAPQPTSIDRIYVKRVVNDQGTDGVGVFLDAFDPTGNSLYYRHEFEETHRVKAPDWINQDLVTDNSTGTITFGLVRRPEEQKVCYVTKKSNTINIVNNEGLIEDRLQNLKMNFIPVNDIRIADRYSILVKQYVQTREANKFYKVLSDFSGSENLFSQIQPGFIRGNVFSETDVNENVVGFFDVSSVAEQRIFFNRDEFITDVPPFELDCEEIIIKRLRLEGDAEFRVRLNTLIILNKVRLLVIPSFPINQGSVLTFVPRVCGDCTAIGESEVPEFWID